ncbi:TPA: transposase family protein [Legionella pneumophila]|nr:transposase family protein [Legionella pneumophila]HBD7219705.1 transposase family protein [Legionella pneumophila]HBD7290030.1 transposase family protein [Legionella pneumophila]HBD7425034.1 transposase family protein [Legionella pneumophila]HBD7465347.1 transposase family protein [Legionella pneumophila]
MNDDKLDSPEAIKAFLSGADKLKFSVPKANCYEWIASTLKRTNYFHLSKKDKGAVREYMELMTGYSWSQLKRLIAQYREKKWIGRSRSPRHTFPRRYNHIDICLLAQTDEAHQTLSGPATKKLFERAYYVYGEQAYERLAHISVSHLYNLRKSAGYTRQRRHFTKTQRSSVNIGERRKPYPEGRPGYIRIDTVHQGDQDKEKGVYHVNAIDEVTQFEVVCSVEKISEAYLVPVLEELLHTFPFEIINFHSDNGSEYINRVVADLLNRMHIKMTKSRARHSNDNALAESKNGSIVRKQFGYVHIEQTWAPLINEFNRNYLTPYLNFHRPCYFAEIKIDAKGKEKKTYPYRCMMTPYEKLKSLPNAEAHLKAGISFKSLDQQMLALSDLQAALAMKKAQAELFRKIFKGGNEKSLR